ncbi:ATP-binding protein [Billgrantia tianxiuensis]|uniref:ATP-binding protein n=1 Tax=Billgrantia tianxiuensis TaxID=2497861 RepID=UPI00191588B9|nr:ATP-binding protein [Halomonas tianxiuensis]
MPELAMNQTKHLLRDLAEVDAQLLQAEKMAAIGQLAAGVAHEINNPIGYVFSNLKALAGYVEDLIKIIDAAEKVSSLEELKSLIEKLEYSYIREDVQALISESEEGIGRVKNIITALKDFSHIEEETFLPADLHRGLDSTLSLASNELKYKADIVKNYGDIPEIECLPSQLNQVALNLLTNAAHAIEGRGTITLSTGRTDDMVWFEVEDSGRGIKSEHIGRLFEPFFTTKTMGKARASGSRCPQALCRSTVGISKWKAMRARAVGSASGCPLPRLPITQTK